MFEISGTDVADLSDTDLRLLVMRLAIAELSVNGLPRSSVTAGGHQDAPDGGVDVRVECPTELVSPDFVPKRLTGFQVKKPDMPASAIREEMRPKGKLRGVICDLAEDSGAYVIVSSQGSVADKPLAERRQAMRDALHNLASADDLHTDFYDRDRLAVWVNNYPGAAAWVRGRIGRPFSGWSCIGEWGSISGTAHGPYLADKKACLIDERCRERECLPVLEGIARLRACLRAPGQCVRLVGLSGHGKTRLVQALFEDGVGDDPLDPSLSVYTDYSAEPVPTARDMARELTARGQRAILIVDNCNPATHVELARLCSSHGNPVSLITIEYDVQDEERENTDVFRLQSASADLLTEWIKLRFPDISQADRGRIAEFSEGNFRVAEVIARTLKKGETLGRVQSRDLFERIFHQRNEKDPQLLRAAEDMSLLYSIEGADTSMEGDLAKVGTIRGIGAQPLYEGLVEMRNRGVVQARGRFRAILPQAIANPLAASALDRIPPAVFDRFCASLNTRMLKSLSRRIGYLHDSEAARTVVTRWLRSDGPLGNLMEQGAEGMKIITNIAPVSPEAVLCILEGYFASDDTGPTPDAHAAQRRESVGLIQSLGYDVHLFERSVSLLAGFPGVRVEGSESDTSVRAVTELFHLHLSGTQAPPEMRRALIRRFAESNDPGLLRCALIALRGLFECHNFTRVGESDFGARPRDWGWQPRINKDVWDWYENAISLTVQIAPENEARALIASSMRSLWRFPGCREAIDRAATEFLKSRPWIEGWLACRATLRYDSRDMPEDIRAELVGLATRLKPGDLLHQARAVVLNRMPGVAGWDYADGEDDEGDAGRAYENADKMAFDIGKMMALDADERRKFLPEVVREQFALRAFEFGRGLASETADLNAMWSELCAALVSEAGERDAAMLGGFVREAHFRDETFASTILEAAIHDAALLPILPYLQAKAALNDAGIDRLRRAVYIGEITAAAFHSIANGSVRETPAESLSALLQTIATIEGGVEVALRILHMFYFCHEKNERVRQNSSLIRVGRELLARANFGKNSALEDYGTHDVVTICLAGEDAKPVAAQVCDRIRNALSDYYFSTHRLDHTLGAIFETQPFIALDAFLLPCADPEIPEEFVTMPNLDHLPAETLTKWAENAPNERYPLIARRLNMFEERNGNQSNELTSVFKVLLHNAPDKRRFLGDFWKRIHPGGWSGSLADTLLPRKQELLKLAEHSSEEVRTWVSAALPQIDAWIEGDRERDREREETFE